MDYAFPSEASEFVYVRSYARWLQENNRRETWTETVDRYISFIEEATGDRVPQKVFRKARQRMLAFETFGSMRLLWSAGKAAQATNVAGYNCAFQAIDCIEAFAECLYILMCGTGYGFSIENKYVSKLPTVEKLNGKGAGTFIIPDSKEGWADSVKHLMQALYAGNDLELDYSLLRPRGSRLKTFGGRCLSGDTIVYKDRKKSRGYNEITIRELCNMKRYGKRKCAGSQCCGPAHLDKIQLRSLDEDECVFIRNQLVDVHFNGRQPVYEILTEAGYRIKATENHRFMNQFGEYDFLYSFDAGDLIAVNGSREIKTGTCIDCGESVHRRSIRCRPCADENQHKPDALNTSKRQRKECRSAAKNYCEQCNAMDVRFEVHHIDRNVDNNNSDNLINLCSKCHRRLHAKEDTLGNAYSHKYLSYDEIVSIKYVGVEDTYDLEMRSPFHNFVANGFVSHNSSGPAPLIRAHDFIRQIFKDAQGRKLKSIECLDILNKIADVVVVGGVRRSSQISLSDLEDQEVANAKTGNIPFHREMSNNSTVYHEKPGVMKFMEEWVCLAKSGRGERGIFNLQGAKKRCPERRDPTKIVGANPCAEILLRSCEFCNLSEVVVRPTDDLDDVLDKIETATWLGAIQSTFTYFPYLSRKWKNNCEQERLLGVSITGHMDNPKLFTEDALLAMKKKAIKVAKKAAEKLGINFSAAITCNKPSGTLSQLANCASGIHSRRGRWIIRRYRISAIDALYQLLKACGVPLSAENKQRESDWKKAQQGDPHACTIYEKGKRWSEDKVLTWVVSFPIEAPKSSVLKDQMTAIEQLEYYKKVQKNWCEHNASCTIQVKDNEWLEVGNWVYQNWKYITGVSFIPEDADYEQMPEEPITEEEYKKLKADLPVIDYSRLAEFEAEDNTTGAKEVACGGGKCDIN